MMKKLSVIVILVLFSFLSGCATHKYDSAEVSSEEGASLLPVTINPQTERDTCGLRVIGAVLRYWGKDFDEEEFYQAYPPPSGGYSLGQLKKLSEKYQLRAFVLPGSEDFIDQQVAKKRPLIVALEVDSSYVLKAKGSPYIPFMATRLTDAILPGFNHYVLVIGSDSESVWLADPIHGIHSISRNHFSHMWKSLDRATLLVANEK